MSQRAKPLCSLFPKIALFETVNKKAAGNSLQRNGLFAVSGKQAAESFELLAQAERIDQLAVSSDIAVLEVVKELAAAAHHLHQAAAGVMILRVSLEVIGQTVDAGGEKSNLNLGRARVARSTLVLGNNFSLVDFDRHRYSFKKKIKTCGTGVIARAVKGGDCTAIP
jgi:hypothetical protein